MTTDPTPDPTTTLAAWRAVTEGATRGPWEVFGLNVGTFVGHGDCGGCSGYPGIKHEPACGWEQVAPAWSRADAAFIATFDPPTVGRLLAFAEAVLALADEWEEGGEPSPDWWYARGLRAALAEHLGGEGQ